MNTLKDFLKQAVITFKDGNKNSLINRYSLDGFDFEYRKLGNSNFYYFYHEGNKFLSVQADKKEIIDTIYSNESLDVFFKFLEVRQLEKCLPINKANNTKRLKI